jgi:uncharacterized protein
MDWTNEPPHWSLDDGALSVTSGPKTDFWRVTHYGFTHDDGHFYHQTADGDFTFSAQFTGQYRDLYDQAGIMLRIDAENWIKCGVEYVEGTQQASVVVTRGVSDWSVTALPQNPPTVWLKLKRGGDGVEVFYSLDGTSYTLLRLAYFPPAVPAQIGLMCASPQGDGFTVRFDRFGMEQA